MIRRRGFTMQVCAALPALQHLDASYGDVQMHAPSALPLAHLHLSRGATAGEALPPSLSAATAPAPALTFLSVAGRVITHPLVTLLAALADLRYLDISACALVEEEAPMLAPLSRLQRLRGVRMRHMLGRFNYLASGAALRHPAGCWRLSPLAHLHKNNAFTGYFQRFENSGPDSVSWMSAVVRVSQVCIFVSCTFPRRLSRARGRRCLRLRWPGTDALDSNTKIRSVRTRAVGRASMVRHAAASPVQPELSALPQATCHRAQHTRRPRGTCRVHHRRSAPPAVPCHAGDLYPSTSALPQPPAAVRSAPLCLLYQSHDMVPDFRVVNVQMELAMY